MHLVAAHPSASLPPECVRKRLASKQCQTAAPGHARCNTSICSSAACWLQEAAEHLEGQKKWLLGKVLALEVDLEEERQAKDLIEDALDDTASDVQRLEAKVCFVQHAMLSCYTLAGAHVTCKPW